nr:peptide chain release factor N(5)-glutamine methyltransferase [Lachnospiraceae bacterium]
VLLKQVTGLGREDLLLSGDEPVANVTREKFMELVGRRATREPLQLVVGAAPFMGFDFTVTPGVLIPRFDTEILVEEAMKTLESGANVLDLCTGTGCVLISLLRYSNETNGVGTDISDIALETAGKNSEDLVENGRVTWLKGDLFDALDREKYKSYFEMITANPPYIKSGDIAGLMPEVRDYEPREALDGGEDGLDLYRRIISEAPYFLKGGAQLLLEIGYDQAQQVRELLEQNGFVDITVTRDYSGNDRVVSARRKISVEGSDAE